MLFDDDRVRAAWVGGSIARGTADRASDLDLLVAVADEHLDDFAGDWRSFLDKVTPTVLAEEQWFARGSFWSITPGFERFDVVVEAASAIPSTMFPVRVTVFDRDGLSDQIPPEQPRSPSPTTVTKLVTDWFHFSAMLETILWRSDWLLADEHLHFLRDLLYKLYVEANQPLPPSGVKRWTEKLTPDQRMTLGNLPTSAHSEGEMIDAHLALSRAFLEAARPLAEAISVTWPADLEAAARQHLQQIMAVDEPYPA